MIPLKTLYNEYIDRSKLSEQKNHLSIYFLPLKRVGTIRSTFSNFTITVGVFGPVLGVCRLKPALPGRDLIGSNFASLY